MPASSPRRLAPVMTGACLIILAGCGSSSDSPSGTGAAQSPAAASAIPVVASTDVYGDIVEQIGAGKVEVTSIISDPDQDPHSYE
ncbi:metal ABC transporter solute-binding protein, Zn/Mn family, partial [Streptomyces sp. SD31]|uniref:metal ABC transporter solute-binding protein, Zn/Mn family n=1 Tax=Streptomyces sp. SD31 TaxID=3452208 RepID=UPI003F8A1AE6